MKIYHHASALRIVGRGYEIRWQLRRLLETCSDPHAPLGKVLADWQPADRRLTRGASIVPFPRSKAGA